MGIDLGGTNHLDEAISSLLYDPFTNHYCIGDGPNFLRSPQNREPYKFGAAISRVTQSNTTLYVEGHFLTSPSEPLISGGLYHLQFYRSQPGAPEGYGQGEKTIGAFLVGPIPSFGASTNFSGILTNVEPDFFQPVCLTVTRTNNAINANQTSEFSNSILIPPPPGQNKPPVAVADQALTQEDSAVIIDVKSNDYDPEGFPITIEKPYVVVPGFWFGLNYGTAELLPDQTVRFVPAPNLNSANLPGPVLLNYTVRDPSGLTAIGTVTIQIVPVNDPPRGDPDIAATLVDSPVTVQVLANDWDPDGDPLTVFATSPPRFGKAQVNLGTSVTYTPPSGFVGVDFFSYFINDGAGGTASPWVTVVVWDTTTGTDLAVSAYSTPATVSPNELVTIQFRVTNKGPVRANQVYLLPSVPSALEVVGMESSQGIATNHFGSLRFEFGALNPNSEAIGSIRVRSTRPGSATCQALVVSGTLDPFPANDRVTLSLSFHDDNAPNLTALATADRLQLSWSNSTVKLYPESKLGLNPELGWHRIIDGTIETNNTSFLELERTSLTNLPPTFFRLKGP